MMVPFLQADSSQFQNINFVNILFFEKHLAPLYVKVSAFSIKSSYSDSSNISLIQSGV